MAYCLRFTNAALKDTKKLEKVGLDNKTKMLLSIIKRNPFQRPPNYEKLVGDLSGYYSRRINIQHRLVYGVDKENKIVKIISIKMEYRE